MNGFEKGKKLLKHIIFSMIDQDAREWPPQCHTLLYQPVRPAAASNSNVSDEPESKCAEAASFEMDDTV